MPKICISQDINQLPREQTVNRGIAILILDKVNLKSKSEEKRAITHIRKGIINQEFHKTNTLIIVCGNCKKFHSKETAEQTAYRIFDSYMPDTGL